MSPNSYPGFDADFDRLKMKVYDLEESNVHLRNKLLQSEQQIIDLRFKLTGTERELERWLGKALEAESRLSWDQRKVMQLKERYAKHAIRYRQRLAEQQDVSESLKDTLKEFATMQRRYTRFFDDVAMNRQTVRQCMEVISHIIKTSRQALQKHGSKYEVFWWK